MKINKILLIVILLFLLVQGVIAVGLAPSSKELILSEKSGAYSVRIFNEGAEAVNVDLEVAGELSEYITLSKKSIQFKQGQEKEDVLVTVSLPQEKRILPGEYASRIIVKERSSGTGEIVAFVGISSRLVMIIPGDGVNLNTNIFTPNFVRNVENSFSVEVLNKGNIEAENCKAALQIYSSTNALVADISSNEFFVKPGTLERVRVVWMPDVVSGSYIAKVKVVCKGVESFAEHSFLVGSPSIKVVSLTSDDFTLGTVSQFILVATSEWGEEINDVYADVKLMKDDALITTYRTESKNFKPLDTLGYDVFLNTKRLVPGEYDVTVKMNYLGKESEEKYAAYMLNDQAVLTSLTGKVVGSRDKEQNAEGSSYMALIILAIIIILVLIVVLSLKVLRKKQK